MREVSGVRIQEHNVKDIIHIPAGVIVSPSRTEKKNEHPLTQYTQLIFFCLQTRSFWCLFIARHIGSDFRFLAAALSTSGGERSHVTFFRLFVGRPVTILFCAFGPTKEGNTST